MRILVIGGTGFIGPWVVRQLCRGGHEVALFHSGSHEVSLPPTVMHLHCRPWLPPRELSWQLIEFRKDLEALRPESVVHMVPMTADDGHATVEAFAGIARRIVVVSSVDVYRAYGRLHGSEPGAHEPLPLTEESPLREKLFPYRGASPRGLEDPGRWLDDYDKVLAEQSFLNDLGLARVVVRLPMVYGPGDRQHRLFPYLRRMTGEAQAILIAKEEAEWRGPRIFMENGANAIALAAVHDAAEGRVYHVSEPDALAEGEWVRQIAAAAGWKGRVVAVPRSDLPEQLRRSVNTEQDLALDTRRIRDELGYREVVSPQDGLRRTVDWERQNPPETLDSNQAEIDRLERAFLERQ